MNTAMTTLGLLAQQEPDTNVSTTGGLGAFLAMFVLALAVWALGWSMTRHLRRVSYLEKQRRREEAREGAGAQHEGGPAGE
ncbi:hypothetical protein SAMN05445756_2266 [Kytococcus aerolatus]|uniref:Uncharacterized protein n=1 Tax=Kytococcus aerolatus TaxID=592308 RepID=A0A212U7W9_9MICO|nr:hypothetical protein [Kytococcus aerolatus]SNC74343.1 hypothetical protein SAMN05445756_2266 [Kytococcus aerolatus]